jgi:glycosyltransferase involved in cell wall biosynthesis
VEGGCERVVGEDCSTDNTRSILEKFAGRDPGRIRLFARDRNLGLAANLRSAWAECRGDYIAMLEGDDYWISPEKLARQVAAMDAHPHWSMCFHRVQVTNEDGRPPFLEPFEDEFPAESGLGDILRRNFVGNVSTMYRRGIVPQLPRSLERVVQQDWPLHALHAHRARCTSGIGPETLRRTRACAPFPRVSLWNGAAAAHSSGAKMVYG